MSHNKLHAVVALLVGAGIFAAAYRIQIALSGAGLLTTASLIDALLGALAAVCLYLLLGYRERRRELLRRQLYEAVSADLNHHVRNALQLILNQTEMMEAQRFTTYQELREAVDRIDWALREILPRAYPSRYESPRLAIASESRSPSYGHRTTPRTREPALRTSSGTAVKPAQIDVENIRLKGNGNANEPSSAQQPVRPSPRTGKS